MKLNLTKVSVLAMGLILGGKAIAQQIPFLSDDPVAEHHLYFQNQGQILDVAGNLRPEILYYTESTFPSYYFESDKILFVQYKPDSIEPDTTFRIDMEFYNSTVLPNQRAGNLEPVNQRDFYKNYYLPHCNPGIEEVHGNEGLIYESAYPNIDVEFTSNVSGIKGRFIVQPGGDPNDIKLKFTGQDQINLNTDGSLEMYLESWRMELPQTYAYQVSGGEATALAWLPLWNHNGGGIVSLTTQNYDPNLPLVVEFGGPGVLPAAPTGSAIDPYWSTYFRGSSPHSKERVVDMVVDAAGDIFNVTNAGFGSVPAQNGFSLPNGNHSERVLITRFGPTEIKEYTTHYGGSDWDRASAIAEDDISTNESWLYVVGQTNSTDIRQSGGYSNFNQMNAPSTDGFIVQFEKDKGRFKWASYYGGNNNDAIKDVVVDKNSHKVYFCGVTTSSDKGNSTGSNSKFPLVNLSGSYYQDYNQGKNEAFIAQYNPISKSLEWSTYFGGQNDDEAKAIEILNSGATNQIIIAGKTTSSVVANSFSSPTSPNTLGQFPLSNPGGVAYFQSSLGSSNALVRDDGFIARFDNSRALTWSTFFGGNKEEEFTDLAIYSNEIYAVGITKSDATISGICATNSNGKVPQCATTTNAYQAGLNGSSQDVLITQFNVNGQLKWATCYGDNGSEAQYGEVSCATTPGGDLFVVSNSEPLNLNSAGINQLDYTGLYYQEDNEHIVEQGSGFDGILTLFNSNNERTYATYFGGGCNSCTDHMGDEVITTVATHNSDWVVFGGFTYSDYLPVNRPIYTNQFPAFYEGRPGQTYEDGFITKLKTNGPTTGIKEWAEKNEYKVVNCYPNPAKNEIQVELPSFMGSLQLSITNALGQVILLDNLQTVNGKLNITISHLAKGMYISQITTKETTYVFTFIKE